MTAGPEPPTTAGPGSDAEPLWVVAGPTASGKSALALTLAERHGCEVLSMDSMAVYRRMDIGTAKPAPGDRARVPHHLLDLVEPAEEFDTARWCAAAAAAIDDVRRRGRRPLFVGGTSLYLMAFFKGLMQGPAADPALRAQLEQQEKAAPGTLHERLQQQDPAAAERIHRRDTRRLVRALEVLHHTGRPISDQQHHFEAAAWARPCRIAAVEWPRADLHRRVRERTEAMLDRGLVDEVAAIERDGGFSRTAGAAIGYAECRTFLAGGYKDREELRNRIRRNTHRLIRRQTTWLRRLREVHWLPPGADATALEHALGAGGRPG
ncbi:MAG: tRNA (adenosine(37)-N6)-dimethylallyltransferase MiaA [Planctomycetota bacterium]